MLENHLTEVVKRLRDNCDVYEKSDEDVEAKTQKLEAEMKEFKDEMKGTQAFFHKHIDAPLTHECSFHIGQVKKETEPFEMGVDSEVENLEEELFSVLKEKK